jgi:predicted nucleic acid-binding protein
MEQFDIFTVRDLREGTGDLLRDAEAGRLHLLIDAGEADAILLALEQDARMLIIDDKKGRKSARSLGLRLTGTGAVLIAAKRAGYLKDVTSVLNDLSDAAHHISPALSKRIIELTGD